MTFYTYEELERMSTAELEQIVDEDAKKPASEQMDDNMLLYILQRIDESGEYNNSFSNTEEARETFLEVYHSSENSTSKRIKWRIKNTRGLRTACIAVLMIVFFCLGGVTAEAAKFGHSKSKIKWTDEYFSFQGIEGHAQGVPAAGDFDTLPILEPYQKILEQGTNMEDVMVTYLPGKYYVEQYTVSHGMMSFEMKLELFNAEDFEDVIILWYSVPKYTGRGYEYLKDPGKPEEYKTNGITHYIMTYEGEWQALWINGSIECCISGVSTKDELIKMIDSIYERDTSNDHLYDLSK